MPPRLLLIGLDAADWKIFHPLIDAGEMPAFSRLLESGASGELLAPQPLVPALLLTSLVTGKRAWQHGLCHGAEVAPDGRQLASISAAQRKAARESGPGQRRPQALTGPGMLAKLSTPNG